jgi:hypothetical protein
MKSTENTDDDAVAMKLLDNLTDLLIEVDPETMWLALATVVSTMTTHHFDAQDAAFSFLKKWLGLVEHGVRQTYAGACDTPTQMN